MQPRKINEHVLLRYHGATSTDTLIYNGLHRVGQSDFGCLARMLSSHIGQGELLCVESTRTSRHIIVWQDNQVDCMQRFYVTGRFDVKLVSKLNICRF